jgi:hypothetical protein
LAIKIQVNKAVEEFDIAGKIYQMDMSDDAIKRWRAEWIQFEKEANALAEKQDSEETEDEAKELLARLYDLFLGNGSFEKVFNDTGRSSLVVTDILKQIMDVVELKYRAKSDENKAKYLNKNKQHQ